MAMGYVRLALYLVGLIIVVGAAWVFLTQTEVGQELPGGLALALILLLVGIGVMASAKSIDDRRSMRRVTYGDAPGDRYVTERRTGYADDAVAPPRETVVEERRFD